MDHSTRRKLLQTGLAAAFLAAGGMPVSAGAKSGGRLRIGLSGGPGGQCWDPRAGQSLFKTVAGSGLVFETLTEISPDGLLRGALARDWVPSSQGQIWHLDLDPSARFHDGRPVRAEDVIASLDLHRADGASGYGIRHLIADMAAPSAHEVTIRLHTANPSFPYLLSDPVLLIGPAEDGARAFAQGIGSGPYRVVVFDGAKRLLTERWGSDRHDRGCWFDTVELLALPRAEDRLAALTMGRVDVIDRIPERELTVVRPSSEYEVLTLPATDYFRFSCGAACPAENRQSLLEGLRLGLDRAALGADAGLHLAADVPVSAAGLPLPLFDPDAARDAFAPFRESGLTLSMDGDLGEVGARLVSVVSRQLAGAGLRVKLAPKDQPGMLHVVRKTTRPTVDWTLLAGLEGSPERGFFDPALRLPTGGGKELDRVLADLGRSGPFVIPVMADANLVVSRRIGRPDRTGLGWDTAHARLAQRWWRS